MINSPDYAGLVEAVADVIGGKTTVNESANSKELALYIQNDGAMYRQMITPTITNHAKKVAKGVYDPEKALISWRSIADEGAKKYVKEFGMEGGFSVADRNDVAKQLRDYYEDEVMGE